MTFNMYQSVDKTEYFLDSLITRKALRGYSGLEF